MTKECPRSKHENDRMDRGGSLIAHLDFVIGNSFGFGHSSLVILLAAFIIQCCPPHFP